MAEEEDVTKLPNPEACVICLERLSERAIALPCKHDHFDFGCLGTWLNQQQVCPLCKGRVTAVKYGLEKDGGTVFPLPPPEPKAPSGDFRAREHRMHPYRDSLRYRAVSSDGTSDPHGLQNTRAPGRRRAHVTASVLYDPAITFRRHVYRAKSYSLRVGSSRISRYQNLTPSSFTSNEALISRAKTWVRRELAAFEFLDPNHQSYGRSSDRRASNAEFLLEFIISILKLIDLRGSSGQAESLLKDFLGQAKARLFLHELESFLRSPYERLEDWDAHVQYGDPDTTDNMVSWFEKQRQQSHRTVPT